MKLILVVPCYNEEAVLAETTRQLSLILDELKEKQRIDEGCILYVNVERTLPWEFCSCRSTAAHLLQHSPAVPQRSS